jgi:hypothetical protein
MRSSPPIDTARIVPWTVDGDRALHGDLPKVGVPYDRDERGHQATESQHSLRKTAGPAGHERLDQDARAGRPEHDDHRGERTIFDLRGGDSQRVDIAREQARSDVRQ